MKSTNEPDFFSVQISEARRFYLDRNPAPGAGLAVVSGGCEHCAADYQIHRRTFPYWGIEFVARGHGTLRLGRQPHRLVPGTLFAYGPGIAQHIATDPQRPLVKYFVDFTGPKSAARLRRLGPKPGTVIQTSAPAEILRIFDDLIRNGQRHTPFSPRLCAVLLEQLLLTIAETAIPIGAASTPAFATYQRSRQHIESHWAELQTLEQIARECHVATAYLCRLFRRFDHRSPYQSLLRLKMTHASERLQNPHCSVKQVADEFGFSDPFHFSRVFKKIIGVSPSALRSPRSAAR